MKIHIIFDIVDSPIGGGNQFLKLLRNRFLELGIYSDLESADVVIFNSYQYMQDVIKAKRKYPDKLFIHRIDGPIGLYSSSDEGRDGIVYWANEKIADGTVFQSNWSMNSNKSQGMRGTKYEIVVSNVCDHELFYPINSNELSKKRNDIRGAKRKVRIIADSWSQNPNKGFDTYSYMDKNMNWDKYEMVFVGNSPVQFDNITIMEPLNSKQLGEKLRWADIYISASKIEACSNSIIEAIATRIPTICFNSSSNPEFIKNGVVLFNNQNEINELIDRIVEDYDSVVAGMKSDSIEDVAAQYISFCENIISEMKNNKYTPKKTTWISHIWMSILKRRKYQCI